MQDLDVQRKDLEEKVQALEKQFPELQQNLETLKNER